jgi:hypothetical protein
MKKLIPIFILLILFIALEILKAKGIIHLSGWIIFFPLYILPLLIICVFIKVFLQVLFSKWYWEFHLKRLQK